jgi:thiamine-phosphate pyrophosphorylase
VDYLIAGALFPTPSKPERIEGIGVAGFADLVHAARGVPVLAIGGITTAVVGSLRSTGAAGIAAIGAFIPVGGVDELRSRVRESADALRLAFDSGSAVP